MIEKVTKLAELHGLTPTITEQVYLTMIGCFIHVEAKVYESIVTNQNIKRSKNG
ncbi:hypothetical protein MK805_06680 [Shimazuella sp. AN120528]|uniref:hypothetical protein n=1 Tax=Shimazuella soli TaxID=1892854 RepID=UPI001F0F680B|nr:hypothetical protein [Shimazuella soli]MCH5584654.1 hypothetical protein [Shimazuella soli]